jgi:protein ImuB
MAATHGAAHALARYRARPTLVVGNEETTAALADLPVAALRLAADLVAALRRLGFDRIGRLAAQPRAPLALRFGPELGRRLDQAYGRLAEPVAAVVPPDPFRVRRVFAEPIGAAETLARCTGELVEELCAALEAKGQGARRLDLLFHRVDNRIEAIRVGTARPARDAKRLTRLLCDRLETVDPGFGVERMALTAVLVEPLGYRPAATALVEAPEPDVAGLVDTLASRVGPERLHRFAAAESDVPERSVRKVAPLAEPTTGRWPARWPRPARLLPTPEPIETLALLPDHPPVHFTWRGVRRRVARADGPERVFGEWWRGDAEARTVRDYFQVETEAGERFWLFREGDGEDAATGSQRWFLQGVFG